MGLAQAFRCQTVAEGVESEDHGIMLLQLGCEIAQGYVIAKPLPAEEIPVWLENWQGFESWQSTYVVEYVYRDALYAEIEHRNWLKQIEDYVRNPEDSFLPTLDPDECKFGLWIKNEGIALFGEAAMQPLVEDHLAIHELALTVKHMDETVKAEEIIQQLKSAQKSVLMHLAYLIRKS